LDPGVENEVVQVATLAVIDWVPQPLMVVPPEVKLTVPVAEPPAAPEMVAVRVVEAG
jgi:hypothetical protein